MNTKELRSKIKSAPLFGANDKQFVMVKAPTGPSRIHVDKETQVRSIEIALKSF